MNRQHSGQNFTKRIVVLSEIVKIFWMLGVVVFIGAYTHSASYVKALLTRTKEFDVKIVMKVGPSGVIDRGAKGRAAPPGKLKANTGPPLLDILIFSIL